MKLKIHHFKLKRELFVVDLHRDIRFVVDFVQISFEIFDIIPHLFLVVVKQFREKLINNDSHPADVPNSHGPIPYSTKRVERWLKAKILLALIQLMLTTWFVFVAFLHFMGMTRTFVIPNCHN